MAPASTINILELEKKTALQFWPELVPFILRALEYDPYESVSVGQLFEQVQKGFARVLITVQGEQLLGSTVVQLFKSTKGDRVLHVVTLAGENTNEWLAELVEKLQELGAKEGCARITLSGRPGWARKSNKYGFRVAHVTMEMRIQENGWIRQEQPAQ